MPLRAPVRTAIPSQPAPVRSDPAARSVETVLAVGRALAAGGDYTRMLAAVIDAVCVGLGASGAGFMRYEAAGDELVLEAPAFGVYAEQTVSRYRVRLADGGNAARVFLSGEPYIANDTRHDPRFIQRFVRLFDTRNTITVPLARDGRPLGIFHAINKSSGDFDEHDRDLLLAVAPLLAATLHAAIQGRALERARHQFDRALHVHAALHENAAGARGLEGVCAALHALTARPLLLLDTLRRPLASCAWPLDPTLVARALPRHALRDGGVTHCVLDAVPPLPVAVVALDAAGSRAGYLLAACAEGLPDRIEELALEQGALRLTVEILAQRSRTANADQLANALLGELFGGDIDDDAAGALLARLALPTSGPWRVLIYDFGADDEPGLAAREAGVPLRDALDRALGALRRTVRLLPWRHGFVAIVSDTTAQRLADRALVRRMQQAIDGIDGLPVALGLRIGVGRLATRPGEIGDALAGAEQALAAATRLPARGAVVRFEDLGIYRLLLGGNAAADHAEFARQVLAPLVAVDTRGQLLASLEALARHDFNCAAAARALGVHGNTMKYRMQQLRDAFGRDPTRGELRLEIELALKIRALG